MFCPQCGKNNDNDENFCSGCGKPILKNNYSYENEKKVTQFYKSVLMFIARFVGMFLLGFGLMGLIFKIFLPYGFFGTGDAWAFQLIGAGLIPIIIFIALGFVINMITDRIYAKSPERQPDQIKTIDIAYIGGSIVGIGLAILISI